MERKKCYKTKQSTFLSDDPMYFVPGFVKRRAGIVAQTAASQSIDGMKPSPGKVELFWVTYNLEFRQYIERWWREDANVKA